MQLSKIDTYIAMRESGMTYESIAQQFGVSRQAVFDAIKKKSKPYKISPSSVIYSGLRTWMSKNRVSVSKMERETGLRLRCGLKAGTLDNDTKKKIAEYTKSNYEELFYDAIKGPIGVFNIIENNVDIMERCIK